MSIFSTIRNAFGGGVRVTIDLPANFTWEEGAIPVVIHFKGHASQPRTVNEIRFHFHDEAKGSRSNGGEENGLDHRWVSQEPVKLEAGSSHTVTIPVPLPFDLNAINQAGAEFQQSASAGARLMGSLMHGAMLPPMHLTWFRMRVSARIEGAAFGANASGKIRSRNTSTGFSVGPIRLS